jgi:hypothetical protein
MSGMHQTGNYRALYMPIIQGKDAVNLRVGSACNIELNLMTMAIEPEIGTLDRGKVSNNSHSLFFITWRY